MVFEARYDELRIEPTLAATRELFKYNKDLTDVLEILTNGYECGSSKRKQNIIEKCMIKNCKEFKVVVAKTQIRYPDGVVENVWRLIHFGKNSFKER
ncbi:MAG: hypothetical protein HZB65_04565 [Candidatus Aenigmarchaeota archaeon]|nr:hypothetical protein [Candidatus Aenigmarchaeota archaeon]